MSKESLYATAYQAARGRSCLATIRTNVLREAAGCDPPEHLELQAIVFAGTAGLILIRSMLRPGARTRRTALARESRRSLRLLIPVFPMLFFAGIIEGFVTPHASIEVRLVTAVATGTLLLAWILLGGRAPAPHPQAS